MLEVMRSTTGQLVMGLAFLGILIVIGTYVVLKFRDEAGHEGDTENASNLLTKFREMKQEGHIDEEEYRTIRTDLQGKLSQQSSAQAGDSGRNE
jgi:uncharacterized membrane protein